MKIGIMILGFFPIETTLEQIPLILTENLSLDQDLDIDISPKEEN